MNSAALKQAVSESINTGERMDLDEKKQTAAQWFRTLRDQICAEFETIEAEHAAKLNENGAASSPSPLAGEATRLSEHRELSRRGEGTSKNNPTASFIRTPWNREDGGSGEMSVMKGRVFEKVGVNISTVHGEFSEQFRKEIPGAAENPTFWASGISLVAHMASPLVPAAHFNTRMIVVGDRGEASASKTPTRLWFGGGGDLNPMYEVEKDTADFHNAFRKSCDDLDRIEAARNDSQTAGAEPSKYYAAFKQWCDEYFFIPHRGVARGVGGIFYDYLGLNSLGADQTPITSGRFGGGGLGKEATQHGMQTAANAAIDWNQAFAFTQSVGRTFASIYPEIIRRHMLESWTQEQRHHQLVKRGRYAEYNLLYDRGTRFGLMTGGNAEAILMSLPPVAIWE